MNHHETHGAACTCHSCKPPTIPPRIAALYAELDAANARRDSGRETHAEQRERWEIEDALTRLHA